MKKGISLITLVITIIVVIILAGAVILTLTQNNPIESANKAAFISNAAEYKSELSTWLIEQYASNTGNYDYEKVNADATKAWYGDESTDIPDVVNIQGIIRSMKDTDVPKYEIQSGKLTYVGSDTKEISWAASIDIATSGENPIEEPITSVEVSENIITATINLNANADLTRSKYLVDTKTEAYDIGDAIWNGSKAKQITSRIQNIEEIVEASGNYRVQVLEVPNSGTPQVKISNSVNVVVPIVAVEEGQTGIPVSDNTTINRNTANYNNPTIPKGFFAVNTTDASWNIVDNIPQGWNNGLVIQDTNGNQFVWVPVSADIGVPYQRWCTSGKSYTDTADVIPTGFNQTGITNTYKGFYISRYEAGFDYNGGNIRSTSKKSIAVATGNWSTIRTNSYTGYLWNFINYTDAKLYSENMDTSYGYDTAKLGTSLPTGTVCDTVMKWLQNATINVAANSTIWGNYANASFTYEWPSTGSKNSGASVLLCSGATNRNKSKNIYDLAGNLREWTSESYDTQFIARGGSYNYYGSDNPAAFRYNYTTSDTVDAMGFRILLCLI